MSIYRPHSIPDKAEIIDDPYQHPSDGAMGVRVRLASGATVWMDACGVTRALPSQRPYAHGAPLDARVEVRMTIAEKSALRIAARDAGLSVNEYVRSRLT